MKRLMVLMMFVIPAALWAQPMVGRIPVSSPVEIVQLKALGANIYSDETPGFVDVILDDTAYQRLTSAGYVIKDIVPLPLRETDLIDPEYHTYEELTAQLAAYETQYPTLCKVDSIGRATQFPRTMWAVKLSDNAPIEEDEIAVIYCGTHHGSEIVGCETLLYMIGHFLQNYGIDPEITQWMNSYEIWFLPLVNPDGHYAVTSNINLFWRKNARDIDLDSTYYEFFGGTWWTNDHEGIDLNRNYNWYWSNDGSSDPWNYDYRGSAPFSESENQAVQSLAKLQHCVAGISFHSYGDVVIAPWTWPGSQYAPDQDVINTIGNALASHFLKDNGSAFSYSIYPGQGGRFPNWFYGNMGTIAYDIELCPYPMFIPPGSQLAERTQRYMNGTVYLLERLSGPGITGHVRDIQTGQPLAARVEIRGRISPQVRPRFAEPQFGRFTRLLNNGTYAVLAAMTGYQTQRIENVVVNNALTPLEIQMVPVATGDSPTLTAGNRPQMEFRANRAGDGYLGFNFNLPQSSSISLRLYDIRGREIATVINGFRNAGVHHATFSANYLPTGVYFARLVGAGFSQVEKIPIVK